VVLSAVVCLSLCGLDDVRVSGVGDGQDAHAEQLTASGTQVNIVCTSTVKQAQRTPSRNQVVKDDWTMFGTPSLKREYHQLSVNTQQQSNTCQTWCTGQDTQAANQSPPAVLDAGAARHCVPPACHERTQCSSPTTNVSPPVRTRRCIWQFNTCCMQLCYCCRLWLPASAAARQVATIMYV
jgi:hypothetical protein